MKASGDYKCPICRAFILSVSQIGGKLESSDEGIPPVPENNGPLLEFTIVRVYIHIFTQFFELTCLKIRVAFALENNVIVLF